MGVIVNADWDESPSFEDSGTWRAYRDIVDGFKLWPMWAALAWQDIRVRYIRTMLGPLWITVSMAVFVFALGLVYSKIFNSEIGSYVPYLTAGLLVWGLISGVLTEAATTFANVHPIIMSVSAPYSVHVYRMVLRHLIIFAHNALVFVGVILLLGVHVTSATLLFIPALLLVCVNLAWINLLVATFGTRFRDLHPIITACIQLIFFLTPLIWDRSHVANKAHVLLVDANPFYHLVEIVRAPLLGNMPSDATIIAVVGMAVCGWIASYVLFARFRRRIPYWL